MMINLKIWPANKCTPVGIYLLKVSTIIIRTKREICSKLIIKTSERRQWRRSGTFIANFQHISHLVLTFLSLTLKMQLLAYFQNEFCMFYMKLRPYFILPTYRN